VARQGFGSGFCESLTATAAGILSGCAGQTCMTSRWAQTILALWIAASTHVDALAADEATASLRREHREEALELRQQHAGESAPPEAPESEGEVAQARQARERQAQDALHARQLRKQLQSAHIRQQ
jgi:hypothetical protein